MAHHVLPVLKRLSSSNLMMDPSRASVPTHATGVLVPYLCSPDQTTTTSLPTVNALIHVMIFTEATARHFFRVKAAQDIRSIWHTRHDSLTFCRLKRIFRVRYSQCATLGVGTESL